MQLSDYIGLGFIFLGSILIIYQITKYNPKKSTNEMMNDILPEFQKRRK